MSYSLCRLSGEGFLFIWDATEIRETLFQTLTWLQPWRVFKPLLGLASLKLQASQVYAVTMRRTEPST